MTQETGVMVDAPASGPDRGEIAEILGRDPGEFFCPDPWTEFSTKATGAWALCCNSAALPYGIADKSPLQHYNSTEMKSVRSAMLKGDRAWLSRYCGKCIARERVSGLSRRTDRLHQLVRSARLRRELPELVEETRRDPEADQNPRYIDRVDLKIFGNLCNLRCVMCDHRSSSAIGQERKRLGSLPAEYRAVHVPFAFLDETQKARFWAEMRVVLASSRRINFTGGEPLLNRMHYEMLDLLIADGISKNLTLEYTTNASRIPVVSGSTAIERWPSFRQVRVRCSIDGVGDKNDYVRFGSAFLGLEENIRRFQLVENVTSLRTVTTVSILTLPSMIEISDWSDRLGLRPPSFHNILIKPSYLQAWHAPVELKARVAADLASHRHSERFGHVVKLLREERDRELYQRFLGHVRELDRHRGTNFSRTFPEFSQE